MKFCNCFPHANSRGLRISRKRLYQSRKFDKYLIDWMLFLNWFEFHLHNCSGIIESIIWCFEIVVDWNLARCQWHHYIMCRRFHSIKLCIALYCIVCPFNESSIIIVLYISGKMTTSIEKYTFSRNTIYNWRFAVFISLSLLECDKILILLSVFDDKASNSFQSIECNRPTRFPYAKKYSVEFFSCLKCPMTCEWHQICTRKTYSI